MRLCTKGLLAAGLLGVAGGAASASTSILSFTITNNTSQAWTSLLFEIKAPLAAPFNPSALAQVLFDTQDANAHFTNNVNAAAIVNESAKQVRFDFNELGRVQPGQTYTYTVTVNNPEESAFRIVRVATPVPTPGAAALAGMAGIVALRRRRAA